MAASTMATVPRATAIKAKQGHAHAIEYAHTFLFCTMAARRLQQANPPLNHTAQAQNGAAVQVTCLYYDSAK